MSKINKSLITVVILLSSMFVGIPSVIGNEIPTQSNPTHLEATGTCSGLDCEDRIIIPLDMTLGELQTIYWKIELLGGYIPHVDIGLDYNGDGIKDDALVIEGAYVNNNINNNTWITGTYLNTFEGANGTPVSWCIDCAATVPTTEINNQSPTWLDSLGQWPTIYTLGAWKTGIGAAKVNSSTLVVNIEIEVDNWIRDDLSWGVYAANAEANIRDIMVNGQSMRPISSTINEIITDPIFVERTWTWGELTLDINNERITNSPYGAYVFAVYTITNTATQGLMQTYSFDLLNSNGDIVDSTGEAGFWINKDVTITKNLYFNTNKLPAGEYTIRLNLEIQNVFPITDIGDNTEFSELSETILV